MSPIGYVSCTGTSTWVTCTPIWTAVNREKVAAEVMNDQFVKERIIALIKAREIQLWKKSMGWGE